MKGIKFFSLEVFAQLRSSAGEAFSPMTARMVVSCVAGLVLCVLSSVSMAQDITATISGEARDPQGAVVPKAKVTLTNTDKNVVIKTMDTDSNGNFIFPGLQVGHYAVTITAPGFAAFEQKDIDLHASDRYPVHAQLKVGSVNEKVTVEASPVQVELETQQVAGLISGTEIRELTLNNRLFEQLVILQPGVSNGSPDQLYVGTTNPFTGAVNRADFSVNGARTNMNNWTIDGADNLDRGSNLTLLNYPSVDAIQEFKVIRGLYNAEYGRAGGGQMDVVTRSGTNQYHGSGYEFWRNDDLNANNAFTKGVQIAAGQQNKPPALRYHDFGFTFGGPVPKLGKTFFFVSEEWRRAITYAVPSTSQLFLPTSSEKQGIMQVPVCIGTVSSASAGACTGANSTIVPGGQMSATALAYLKDIYGPAPNSDPTTHFFPSTFRNQFDDWQNLVRIDHQFSEKFSVFGRYMHDTIPTVEPFGIFGPNSFVPGAATSHTLSPGTTWAAHATYTFSPTLLLEGGYNFSYGAIISRMLGTMDPTNSPDIHPTLPFAPQLARLPSVSFVSFSGLGASGPYDDFNRNHTAFATVTKVFGKHTLRAGFTYHHYQKTENANGNNPGTYSFDSSGAIVIPSHCTPVVLPDCALARASQSWANFLMGRVSGFSQASEDITPDIRGQIFESFVQDEFHPFRNLSVNIGGRWQIFRQPTDANGELTNFDPAAYSAANAVAINPANGLILLNAANNPTQGSLLNGIIIAGQNSRFGDKVANENMNNFEPRVGLVWDPFGKAKTAIRTGYGISHDYIAYGNFESNIFTNPPFNSSISIAPTSSGGNLVYPSMDNPGAGVPNNALPRNLRIVGLPFNTPYIEQYSLDVQQEIAKGMVLDVGYFGASAHHLSGFIDLNQPQVGAYVTQLGMTPPITSGTQSQRLNAIRPFLGYGAISDFVNIFGSNYSALQASLQRVWKDGSLVKVNYTWSHNLGDVDPTTGVGYSTSSNFGASHITAQDRYNTRLEYGPTSLDRRHVLSADFVLMEPWFKEQHGLLGHLAGGWELSGITTVNSGLALTPRSNPFGALSNVDFPGLGCIGVSGCISMPNQVSDPNSGAPHTITQWFNTSAFVPNASVAPGNAARGSVIGPGFWRQDLSLFKNMSLTERFKAQLRAEAFNVFNHTNLNAVDMRFGLASFGTVTSSRDPRILQFAVKLMF